MQTPLPPPQPGFWNYLMKLKHNFHTSGSHSTLTQEGTQDSLDDSCSSSFSVQANLKPAPPDKVCFSIKMVSTEKFILQKLQFNWIYQQSQFILLIGKNLSAHTHHYKHFQEEYINNIRTCEGYRRLCREKPAIQHHEEEASSYSSTEKTYFVSFLTDRVGWGTRIWTMNCWKWVWWRSQL